MSEKPFSGTLPILALRGLAVFPDQTVHFDVGRAKSIQALDEAMKGDQYIFLVPQRSILVDNPKVTELYPIGVVAQVEQVLKTQGDDFISILSYLALFCEKYTIVGIYKNLEY